MDISPDTHILESLRRGERLDYALLIGEAVDNAFDANASSVEIEISPKVVSFRDDGNGVKPDKIGELFRLGGHNGMATTKLGQFGIGIKFQAVRCGDILRVDSISEGGHVTAFVNWADIQRTGQWKVPEPRIRPVAVDAPKGTTIYIERLREEPEVDFDELRDETAKLFHPALASGKRITINGISVGLVAEPTLSDIAEVTIQLSGNRSAHIRAGILAAPSKLSRVHVGYEHRTIMPGSTLGCGKHTGLNRIFARVTLLGKWELGRFKNELPRDSQRRELDRHVAAILHPLLERCATESMEAALPELAQELMDMLPEEISAARPRRNTKRKDKASPKVESRKGVSGWVDQSKSDPGGPAKSRKPKAKILITFEDNQEEVGFGAFVAGDGFRSPHRIELSKDHPVIADILTRRDRADAKTALYFVAIALYTDGIAEWLRNNGELPYDERSTTFGKRMSRVFPVVGDDGAAIEPKTASAA